MSSFQPDLVPFFEWSVLHFFDHVILCSLQCFLCHCPMIFNLLQSCCYSRYWSCSCWLVDMWGMSQDQLVWCFLCSVRWPQVSCILGKQKPFCPCMLVICAHHSKLLFWRLVGPFTLAISLWVVGCAYALFYTQEVAEFCHKVTCEAGVAVQYDFLGQAIVWYHMTGI